MKINVKELVEVSYGKCTLEGRLHYRKETPNRSGFKEKWFKLRYNMLFYYNLSETGTILENKPSGVFVLENCVAFNENMSENPCAFSLKFEEEAERHIFVGRTEDQIQEWVLAINSSSYEYWKNKRDRLQNQLNNIYGRNPFLPVFNNSDEGMGEDSTKKARRRNKLKENPSFRSYLQRVDSSEEAALHFVDHHFDTDHKSKQIQLPDSSGNSLEAIGDLRVNSVTQNGIITESNVRSAESLLDDVVVMRKAPPPPVPPRPPRGQKVPAAKNTHEESSSRAVVTENLIDL